MTKSSIKRLFKFFLAVLTWQLLASNIYCGELKSDSNIAVNKRFFGVHLHKADKGTRWPVVPFGSWRLWDAHVAWPDLEPRPGVWDFSRLDRYVAMAKLTDVEILLPLGLSPAWIASRPEEPSAYGAGKASVPADMKVWERYVETVAARYKGKIKYYEVWNEANLSLFYTGSIDQLIEMQRIAQNAIKRVDNNNRLVSTSFTGNSISEIRKFGSFLRRGGCETSDIIGYHLYTPKESPEAVVRLIKLLRDQLADTPCENKPFWNTESGYVIRRGGGVSEPEWISSDWLRLNEEQGAIAWMVSYTLAAQGGVERSFMYSWDNDYMGFVGKGRDASDNTLGSLEKFAQWLNGLTPVGCKFEPNYTSCTFRREQHNETLYWTKFNINNLRVMLEKASSRKINFCLGKGSEKVLTNFVDISNCPTVFVEN